MIRTLLTIKSWTDYFPEPEITPNLHDYIHNSRFDAVTHPNFYVSKVVFITTIEPSGKGGAICCIDSTQPYSFLVEYSDFLNCHAYLDAGGIYFECSNSVSFLNRVCVYNCYSTSTNNHFCFISPRNNNQKCTNGIDFSSFTGLSSQTTFCENINMQSSANITLQHLNVTKNSCFDDPFLYAYPATSATITYSNIDNNTVTRTDIYGKSIAFDSNAAYEMNTCNFIGNIGNKAHICVHGTLLLKNSCLIENNDKPMFQFSWSDTTSLVTIINCTIDNTKTIDPYGSVSMNEADKPDKPFKNNLINDMCFVNNKSYKGVCKTADSNKNKCNMMRRRGILMLAKF